VSAKIKAHDKSRTKNDVTKAKKYCFCIFLDYYTQQLYGPRHLAILIGTPVATPLATPRSGNSNNPGAIHNTDMQEKKTNEK
jgi:hypothetical protein